MNFIYVLLFIALILFVQNSAYLLTTAQTNHPIENIINQIKNSGEDLPRISGTVNSLNETTIQSMVNSMNQSTIQSMVNSLNGTIIQSINSLLESVNYLTSVNFIQNIATIIAAVAAAASSGLLFFSFRSQNKLMKIQFQESNATINNLRQNHYRDVREIFKKIILQNAEFITFSSITFLNPTSIRMRYDIQYIKHIIDNIAGTHLNNDYPKFNKDLEKIHTLGENLDAKVDNQEKQLISKIRDELCAFDPLERDEKPIIFKYIYQQWLIKLSQYEKDESIEKLDREFKGIESEYPIQTDEEYKNAKYCLLNEEKIFEKTEKKNRKDFFWKVNELIKDKELWRGFEEILKIRKNIINIINNSNSIINSIIIQINKNEYSKTYECCK